MAGHIGEWSMRERAKEQICGVREKAREQMCRVRERAALEQGCTVRKRAREQNCALRERDRAGKRVYVDCACAILKLQ